MKDINKNGVNKHTPATFIRNFYNGLDGWSKCFLDSLTSGRFASGIREINKQKISMLGRHAHIISNLS